MPATSSIGPLAIGVIELQRGVLEIRPGPWEHVAEEVLLSFRHRRDNERAYLALNDAASALAAMLVKGVPVVSIDADIAALPKYKVVGAVNSHFGNYLIPEGLSFAPEKAEWRRYSFAGRRFLRAVPLPAGDGRWQLFLREGQIAIALDGDRFVGYYQPYQATGELARCKNPQEALTLCHWQSLPAKVYFRPLKGIPYAALFRTTIWLPPEHRKLLYERLLGARPQSGQEFVPIHVADLPAVERILGSLGISLEEGEPPEKSNAQALHAVETAAEAIQQAYRAYLKNEERVGILAEVGQKCAWEQVEDLEFRDTLVDLSNRAYEFEPYAVELLAYLAGKLPYSLDWKSLLGAQSHTLEGVVLSAGQWRQERPAHAAGLVRARDEGGAKEAKYCKLIVQEFGLVLGVVTRRGIMEAATPGQVEYFVSEHWRATPYAGRLKFTGPILSERVAGKQAAEEGYSYICGIPSMEAQLASELYLSAFFLDRDSQYWRGHNELSRYFSGHGRLVEKMVADFDEPAALFQDIFGNYFYLKFGQHNYLAHKEFIEGTDIGSWKRFVAHTGLRALLTSESGLPAFDLGHGSVPRGVGHLEVAESTSLGLLRYYGQIDEVEFRSRLANSLVAPNVLDKALQNLQARNRIVASAGILYYGYAFCSLEDRIALSAQTPEQQATASIGARAFFSRLQPCLPMMHPLGYGSPLVGPRGPEEQRQLEGQSKKLRKEGRFAHIVKRHTLAEISKAATEQVREYGAAALRTHPWNLLHAMSIVGQVRAALPGYDIELHRKDMPTAYEGQETIDIWLRLCCRDVMERHHMVERLRHRWLGAGVDESHGRGRSRPGAARSHEVATGGGRQQNGPGRR